MLLACANQREKKEVMNTSESRYHAFQSGVQTADNENDNPRKTTHPSYEILLRKSVCALE